MPSVRPNWGPLDIAVLFLGLKISVLLLFAPELIDTSVEHVNLRICQAVLLNEKVDADTHLDAKDVVRGTGKLGILAHVPAQIQNVEGVEIICKMLAHPVEGDGVEKAVVGHQGDNPLIADAVGRPPERLYIWIS